MASRPPVNKVSPRLRPGDRSSESVERTVRRRGGAAGKSAAAPVKSGGGKSRTKTVRVTPASSRPTSPAGSSRPAAEASNARRLSRPAVAGWGLAIALVAVSVLLTAFAVIAAFKPGVDDGNKAFVDNKATQEVTAAADTALKTVYSYDVKTIGGYKDAVHKVVTGKMRSDFDKFADTTVSAIQQARSTAQAKPDPIGVTLLTDDRAELLVDLTVSATKDGAPQESASGPIVLHMQKVGGHWLASEISDR